MIKFFEFDERYRQEVIDFWMRICVEEFGFTEWEKDIKNMDNYTYKQKGGNFWIAVENEEIIGTISLQNLGEREGLLKAMYVHQEYRNKKIASKLMDILLDFAKEKHYKKIKLDTYKEFQAAIKFYEKNGFIRKEEIDNKYIYEKEI